MRYLSTVSSAGSLDLMRRRGGSSGSDREAAHNTGILSRNQRREIFRPKVPTHTHLQALGEKLEGDAETQVCQNHNQKHICCQVRLTLSGICFGELFILYFLSRLYGMKCQLFQKSLYCLKRNKL